MKRNIRVLLIVLVVLALAGGTFAFAAANTIAKSAAGYKASDINGYAISNVHYVLNTDPTKLDKIIFDVDPLTVLDPAAVTVKISTNDLGTVGSPIDQDFTSWHCAITESDLNNFTCTFWSGEPLVASPANVVDVVHLSVVASSSMP